MTVMNVEKELVKLESMVPALKNKHNEMVSFNPFLSMPIFTIYTILITPYKLLTFYTQ